MRIVKIREGNRGVVSKNGKFLGFIGPGKHWLYNSHSVEKFSEQGIFDLNEDLRNFMESDLFLVEVNRIHINDSQLGLLFEDGIFSMPLGPGNYFSFKKNSKSELKIVNIQDLELDKNIDAKIYSHPMMLKYIRVFNVEHFTKAALIVNGQFEKFLTGGTYKFWVNDTTIHLEKAETRASNLEILGQEILTQDSATLRINFNVKYQVLNFEKALIENRDFVKQLYITIQMALRGYVGALSLDELMQKKGELGESIISEIAERANSLGVKIMGAGIKDLILPGEMKEILNKVLIAQKQAQANVISRREETAATRSMVNTAKLMEENNMLLKLKEMEYVERIADKVGEISLSGNGKMMEQLKEIFTK